jgi:ABC-type nitrate/sulfonate/bicarbonate transport system substrate-binding protein
MKAPRFLSSLLTAIVVAGCGSQAASVPSSTASAPAASSAKPAASGSSAASAPAGASSAAKPAAASGVAKPSGLMKITLGTPSAAAPSALVPLAKDAGLYEKYGFDATVQVFDGSKNLLSSMFSGQVPITYQGSPEVIAAALHGADIVMVGGIINTLFFSVFTRPDITQPAQLKGKKIGYTFAGNDEAGAKVALAHYGLHIPEDITPINMQGGQAARIAALQNGAVDSISLAPPFTYQAKKLGLHELAADADLGVEFQSGTFATSRAYLKDHRDVVVRFTKAYSEAIKFMKTNKEASMKSLGAYTKTTDQDLLEQSYEDFAHKYVSKVPNMTIAGTQYVMDNLIQEPEVKSHKPEDFMDLSIVKQLTDEGFYRGLGGDNTAGV